MTHEEFAAHINKLRLANKNNWYIWQGTVNGLDVQLKGFNTWLQIFTIDGIDHGNCADRSVKQYKQDIIEAIEYALEKKGA